MALTDLYLKIARKLDGAELVRTSSAVAQSDLREAYVLALGKVARPMFEGFTSAKRKVPRALLVVPEEDAKPLPRFRVIASDHPQPTARSVAAAKQAREFLERLKPSDDLVVLLSGGGSALLAAPAGDLTLEDKRATVTAVARAGATIAELNTVRKHLSSVKGGQLGMATAAMTTVFALSDVVGNDPATIASGPFSPDPTTFAQALDLVRRLAPDAPAAARAWLERGAAGGIRDTPKPKDPRLGHIRYHVVAGPDIVVETARYQVMAAGFSFDTLSTNTEEPVPALAASYAERARRALSQSAAGCVLVGNGEPRITVTGDGKGGRATHLALLVAREIAGLDRVSFLAAGTDRRDGSADGSGAVVDGSTWERALRAGLDPRAALDRFDSGGLLSALGCMVRGPGRSNLLDLHLLQISPSV